MRLIKPFFEIIDQPAGLDGVYKQIEVCGRVSYKSEYMIKDGSAKTFVNNMVHLGHGAVLEHGTVYLKVRHEDQPGIYDKYIKNPYSRVVFDDLNRIVYITTNYRVIFENNWEGDLQYLCDCTEYHKKRVCVKFTMDRIGSQSFCRHRVFSFVQESTRFCDYSKDRFRSEVVGIIPSWCVNIKGCIINDENDLNEVSKGCNVYEANFLKSAFESERYYMTLLGEWDNKIPDKRYKTGYRGNPWRPEQARTVLQCGVKTEIIMTGFVDDWWGYTMVADKSDNIVEKIKNSSDELDNKVSQYLVEGCHIFKTGFFGLRCEKSAHEQARELAIPLMMEFKKRNYV